MIRLYINWFVTNSWLIRFNKFGVSSELGFFLSQSDARYQYIGEISGVRHPWFFEKSLKLDWLYGYIVYNIRAFNVI